MTIYEVLKETKTILEGLRIPATEEAIYRSVRAAIINCQACLEAIERSEAEAARQAAEDGGESPGTDRRNERAGSGEGGMRGGQPARAHPGSSGGPGRPEETEGKADKNRKGIYKP